MDATDTRLVEISKIPGHLYNPETDQEKESNWIILKWFQRYDYKTQEELNDRSEIFMNEIARETDLNRPLRIRKINPYKNGGFNTEIVKIIFPNELTKK